MPTNSTLYDTDFYAWANEQATLLRSGDVSKADLQNIAEEIESMGRSEKRELVSRLTVLLVHLMKWRYQPTHRGTSWKLTVEQQRYQLEDHLKDNPSLKSQLADVIVSAYRLARAEASRETGLDRDLFPPSCPFTIDQIMNPDFWPE
jgi:hypothetical protein